MPLPRPPAAVIFDMDGLLIDSEVLYRDAFIESATAMGRELPLDVFIGSIGLSGDDTRRFFADLYGPTFDFEAYRVAVRGHFAAASATRLRLKAGVEALIDALEAASLPLAVATSSGHEDVKDHLGRFGLHHRFATIVARGDYPRGKPDPAPFLTAAARLDVAPADCLVLEDSHNGVRAAAAAGTMTVMVPDLVPPTDEIRALCCHVAEDLHEVLGMLIGERAPA